MGGWIDCGTRFGERSREVILKKLNDIGRRFSPVNKEVIFAFDRANPTLEFQTGCFEEVVVDLYALFRSHAFQFIEPVLKRG